MFKILLFLSIFVAKEIKAEVTLKNLNGIWISGCIQTQNEQKEGHVKEIYDFKDNVFVFKREWYKDPQCKKISHVDVEEGSFQIGDENTTNSMYPAGTYDIEFIVKGSSKSGLIWLNDSSTNLRISRNFGNNSLLSLFIYSKQK